jgi:predicted MFS family arabinose efflux permease
MKRIGEFFALKRNLAILLIAIFVIGAGEELWMRFIPKYLATLGAPALAIGLYDGLRTLLGAVYAYPGGVVVDRWGHRRAFLVFNLISIVGYAIVLLVPHWSAVLAGMFLFLSWSCFSLPATFSLVAASLAKDRYAMGIGVQAVIKRMPIMIAPVIGGILIDRLGVINGVRIGLIMSVLLSAATILVQRKLRDEPNDARAASVKSSFWQSLRGFNQPTRQLLACDILVRFCERLPYAWVVIFAMDYVGVSARDVGLLTTVEVLTASLCILPTSYFADKTQREPFVLLTFAMFTLFPISLMVSKNFSMLIIAFFIRGLKEFGDTSRKALIVSYADAERRGQTVGAYYLVRDVIVSVGALLGAWLWHVGPRLNFLAAAGFGIAGTIIYFRGIRNMQGRSHQP